MFLAGDGHAGERLAVPAADLHLGLHGHAELAHHRHVGVDDLRIEALADLDAPEVLALGARLLDLGPDERQRIDRLVPVLQLVVAHADVEVGHVRPLRPAGDLGEAAEQGEARRVLAGGVLAETGLEQRLVVEGGLLLRLFLARLRGEQAGEQHEVAQGLLGLALVEVMLAHRHVRHVGERRPLVVAHHRIEHRDATLVLFVLHELDRLVVEVFGTAVDIGGDAGAGGGGGIGRSWSVLGGGRKYPEE